MFFDLEGDPFIGRGGREYLFGFVADDESGNSVYGSRWAVNAEEEKRAFETFVDTVMARWAKYPAMHVYHFTGYESGALKRLMGRYATREDEIDRMLRAYLLVDLHTVTKRSLRASVEHYSLKALEPFYGFERRHLSKMRGLHCGRSSTRLNLAKPCSWTRHSAKQSLNTTPTTATQRAPCATGLRQNGGSSNRPASQSQGPYMQMERRQPCSMNVSNARPLLGASAS